jgi:hypothetical protein
VLVLVVLVVLVVRVVRVVLVVLVVGCVVLVCFCFFGWVFLNKVFIAVFAVFAYS